MREPSIVAADLAALWLHTILVAGLLQVGTNQVLLRVQRRVMLVLCLAVLVATSAAVSSFVVLPMWAIISDTIAPMQTSVFVRTVILGSAYVGLGLYVLGARRALAEREAHAVAMAQRALEAKHAALVAKVNPHFLFNALNSAMELTSSNPRKAEDMLMKLSMLFRSVLDKDLSALCPLRDEIDLIEAYLSVEQFRFGSRLVFEVIVDDAAESTKLPPLLLQPLVENAVVHGVSQRSQSTHIRVTCKLEDRFLKVHVGNTLADPSDSSHQGTGTGLQSVRERLFLHYGSAGSIEVGSTEQVPTAAGPVETALSEATFRVTLFIPQSDV